MKNFPYLYCRIINSRKYDAFGSLGLDIFYDADETLATVLIKQAGDKALDAK